MLSNYTIPKWLTLVNLHCDKSVKKYRLTFFYGAWLCIIMSIMAAWANEGKRIAVTKKQAASELYSFLGCAVRILAAVTLVFVFAVRLVSVSGSSMYPTLYHGDLLVLESSVLAGDVKAGDIVVMTVPYFENEPIVKRVIATEGQTVDIDFDRGIVYVDGRALDEPYVNEPTYRSFAELGMGLDYPVTVTEGHLFVMGDNRNASDDSRFAPVGLVDVRNVLGKVLLVAWPGSGEGAQQREFSRIGGIA